MAHKLDYHILTLEPDHSSPGSGSLLEVSSLHLATASPNPSTHLVLVFFSTHPVLPLLFPLPRISFTSFLV